jgi:hypothetical protein
VECRVRGSTIHAEGVGNIDEKVTADYPFTRPKSDARATSTSNFLEPDFGTASKVK